MSRIGALLVGLLSFASAGADARGQVRAWLGPGFDSNAKRDYLSEKGSRLADGFLFGLVEAQGRLTVAPWLRFRGAYDAAGRLFLLVPTENSVVQSAQLEAAASPTSWLSVGLLSRARDRRGAERDYTDLSGGLTLDILPAAPVEVRLTALAHRFIYRPRFAASWWGPDGLLSVRYRVTRHHSLLAFGQYAPRTYNAVAEHPSGPAETPPPPGVPRTDSVLGAGLSYAYRGAFHLSAGYSYLDQTSNSWGETLRRHRLAVTGGVPLPWELTLVASATLQLASYPDGVFLSEDVTVVEDGDYGSSVLAKLVRPLGAHVELDVRYALYVYQFPANRFLYVRHVVSLGVAVSF